MSANALMLADLKRSGLNGVDVAAMQLASLDAAAVHRLTKHARVPAYVLPYFDQSGVKTDFFRLRFLGDVHDLRTGKVIRYWQPPKSPVHAYFPPGMPWQKAATDAKAPLLVTEGEKKAYAGAKLLNRLVFGIGGNWSFQVNGELLPELKTFDLTGRLVEFAPDGDWQANPDVRRGWEEFSRLFVASGAEGYWIRLRPGDKLDDVLVREGTAGVERCERVPFDARKMISLARVAPKIGAHERKERIASIVEQSLLGRGSFHNADDEPLYFDKAEHRLISLRTHDDPAQRAFLLGVFGINASQNEYRFVHEQLHAYALRQGGPALTPLFAHFDRAHAVLYVDVGGGRIARVTEDGHALVPNGTDDALFRGCSMSPVEIAKRGSEKALRTVLDLPNFAGGRWLTREQQQMVWKLHFFSLFFPSELPTRPLVLLYAQKGAGKSTGARAIGLSLYGPDFEVTSLTDPESDELTAALVNNPLVVVDNIDGRMRGIENLLAVAATGGKITRRALYTTMQQVKFALRARVIATSRQPDVFVRDDMRDRTVILPLEPIEHHRAESDIQHDVLAARPALWAHVLERLPAIVRALSRFKERPIKHRLADFSKFCLAAGPVLGYRQQDVETMLDALESERTAFANDHSSLLQALNYWINWQRVHEKKPLGCERFTAAQLLASVRETWPEPDRFPFRNPTSFGLAIKNEEATLRDAYEIKREGERSHTTLITIRPRPEKAR